MESWNFFSGEASTSPTALGLFSELFSGTTLVSPDTSSLSLDSGSRVSGPLVEPKSSLIALKLGSQSHGNNARCRLREATTQVSSSSSSPPTKRARVRGVCSQTTPFCQAFGCNMDLSGSKDYHRKHKVCDFHSKSPKVIVDGIEQRFCQQCSRFHLLGEFDDSKRSCRRRLAGHNKRRRKPQFDAHSDKPYRFSNSYQGDKFVGTSLQNRTPFVFSDILPGVVLSPENYEQVNNPFGQFKFEEKPVYGAHHYLASSKSSFPLSETEDYCFNQPARFHGSLEASSASRALSLLSAQSQNFSSHSAMPRHCFPSNGFYSSGTDLMEPAMMIPEANHRVAAVADFEVISDGDFFQGASYLQPKYCLAAAAAAPENGSTVDLLQLSSHLQRVEHQRSFMQVKQENDEFCCFQTA